MGSLEEAISKFDGAIIGGRGKTYSSGTADGIRFDVLYMPQILVESNMSGSRNEFDFDVDYNVSALRLVRWESTTDMSPHIKSLLNKLESTHLIYDPRYLYIHNKDKIKKLDENTYSLELSYDFGSALPAVKLRLDFILHEEKLNNLKIFSIDKNDNGTIHSEIFFDYENPWPAPIIPPEDEETPEEPEQAEEVDPANAWMQ